MAMAIITMVSTDLLFIITLYTLQYNQIRTMIQRWWSNMIFHRSKGDSSLSGTSSYSKVTTILRLTLTIMIKILIHPILSQTESPEVFLCFPSSRQKGSVGLPHKGEPILVINKKAPVLFLWRHNQFWPCWTKSIHLTLQSGSLICFSIWLIWVKMSWACSIISTVVCWDEIFVDLPPPRNLGRVSTTTPAACTSWWKSMVGSRNCWSTNLRRKMWRLVRGLCSAGPVIGSGRITPQLQKTSS